MIGLQDMRCFVEVVDSGGVNRAAARLGLSKSIVSRRIAAMEEDLGVQLLARSTRGVAPTEAGREYRARCERILSDVSEAREAVIARGGDVTGRLRVTAPLLMGRVIVGPVLAELAMRYPRPRIDAAFTDRVVDLIGEGFDLAIRFGEPVGASLIARKIAPMQAVLVASPACLARAGVPMAPADLAAHACLIYAPGNDWRFRLGRRWVTVRPGGRLRTDSGDALVQWAMAGLGIAKVPEYLAATLLESGALARVLPEFPQPELGIRTLRPPGPRAPAKVTLLTEALVARTKAGPGLGQGLADLSRAGARNVEGQRRAGWQGPKPGRGKTRSGRRRIIRPTAKSSATLSTQRLVPGPSSKATRAIAASSFSSGRRKAAPSDRRARMRRAEPGSAGERGAAGKRDEAETA